MSYIYWIQNARTKYEANLFLSALKHTPKSAYIQGDDSYQISHNVRRFVGEGQYPILVDSPVGVLPYNPADIILSVRPFHDIPILKVFHTELQILNVDSLFARELVLILGHDTSDLALLLTKGDTNNRNVAYSPYLNLDILIADAKFKGCHHVLILREAQI